MAYSIKEIFYSLQGEGEQVGRPAVFVRFAGCNLWSGSEEERSGAICKVCDTDFVGTDGPQGGLYEDAVSLAETVRRLFPLSQEARPFVICTGGEPLLQLDEPLVKAFHDRDFEVALETNGTLLPPPGIDWVCVSPKPGAPTVLEKGDELKLLFPQTGIEPERFEGFASAHFFLQPIDGPDVKKHTEKAVRFCLDHPRWRLSIQMHKMLGIK